MRSALLGRGVTAQTGGGPQVGAVAIGASGRERVLQQFDIERVTERYLSWYAELLAPRHPGPMTSFRDPDEIQPFGEAPG